MTPIIISVAPNGARKTKDIHPNIPLTVEEIAVEALRCRDAGATLLHLHIRDKELAHTLDAGIYKEAISAVREAVGMDMIIQATTESVGRYSPEEQMQMVRDVRPEAVSIAIREVFPDASYKPLAKDFLGEVAEYGICPQFILYSPEDVAYFAQLKKEGIIPAGQDFILFVLGKKAANPSKEGWSFPEDIEPFLQCFDGTLELSHTQWGACAFGGYEHDCMIYAAKEGGHVRIGFENNHLNTHEAMAENNAELIEQFTQHYPAHTDRAIATISEARALLGIKEV